MKIETQRLESITDAIEDLFLIARRELQHRQWDGSFESGFVRMYKHYEQSTEWWNNTETGIMNPYSFEDEVKGNFLTANDNQRDNYLTLLKFKSSELRPYLDEIKELVGKLRNDIGNGVVNPDEVIDDSYAAYSTVSTLIYMVEWTHDQAEKVLSIIDNSINIFMPSNKTDTSKSTPANDGIKLKWLGTKTDLAEIVWVLSKTGRIVDTATGQPATIDVITNKFEELLSLDSLDVHGLLKGRYGTKSKPTTYKVQDGRTFINDLQDLINQRIFD